MTKDQFMKLLSRLQQAQQMIVGEPGIYIKLETETKNGISYIYAAVYDVTIYIVLLQVEIYQDDNYKQANKSVSEFMDSIRRNNGYKERQ